jgi:NhaP-type Na+/H+ and K+/H+ antiporter
MYVHEFVVKFYKNPANIELFCAKTPIMFLVLLIYIRFVAVFVCVCHTGPHIVHCTTFIADWRGMRGARCIYCVCVCVCLCLCTS